jgi:hypothetical protein
MHLTPQQAKYIAHDLTLQHAGGGLDHMSQALFNASVDLNPHPIEATVLALRFPSPKRVLLTNEAGIVQRQHQTTWKRRFLDTRSARFFRCSDYFKSRRQSNCKHAKGSPEKTQASVKTAHKKHASSTQWASPIVFSQRRSVRTA